MGPVVWRDNDFYSLIWRTAAPRPLLIRLFLQAISTEYLSIPIRILTEFLVNFKHTGRFDPFSIILVIFSVYSILDYLTELMRTEYQWR